ncbi:Uncharacterized protein DBV15_09157 [Temnothorax longispinosus]|uniref:Uncharacterized protein n=1 Tax=Temnothorax longispinosus TaxID=300112 RepID=A0A4V3S9E1_9HYME|nr:Uncharacterized protein DBV15_09157 [Temnothorax longispinosus]
MLQQTNSEHFSDTSESRFFSRNEFVSSIKRQITRNVPFGIFGADLLRLKARIEATIKSATGKLATVVEDERVRLRRKREALEVAAITADKQLEISPKEEFSGNGAAGQKRGRAQRKLTAKGKK